MVMAVVLSPSLGAETPAARAAEAVARSLCALVRATVEGVVREAFIIGPAEDQLTEIADQAGCGLIEAHSAGEGLAQAAARSRSEFAFVLLGGFAPQSSFVEEAGDLLRDAQAFHGVLLRRFPNTLMTRLAPGLAEPVGVFAQCAALRDAAPRDLKHLIRRLKIRRTLDARAQKLV